MIADTPYEPLRPGHAEYVPLRQLRVHVRRWGAPPSAAGQPLLVLLHGWMDVGASFQFVVDALDAAFAAGRCILAPDWRGFGLTSLPVPCDHYVYADYLADLDALLDHYAPEGAPVDLVGHSMGGNIALHYAGARPARVRRLVSLEGFGLPATQPAQAPQRMAQWLDALKQLRRGDIALKPHASAADVARRLMKNNPRLPPGKAQWLARHWARPDADGAWRVLGDAAHKIPSPMLYRAEEAMAAYAAITAPVLAVQARSQASAQWWADIWKGQYTLDEYHQRLAHVRHCRVAEVADAGHMLHHDQPQAVARLVQDFLE